MYKNVCCGVTHYIKKLETNKMPIDTGSSIKPMHHASTTKSHPLRATGLISSR